MRVEIPPPNPRGRARSLVQAGANVATVLICGVLPALILVAFVAVGARHHLAFDFHQFWQGPRDVLNGVSPYASANAVPAQGDPSLSPQAIQDVYRFPYPAPALVLLLPLGALPFTVAAWILIALLCLSVVLSLRLLGVGDARCVGVAFLWISTLGAIRLGTITPLLLLAVACSWRFRERTGIAAMALATVVVLKLFLWPLLLWPLFRGRPRVTLYAGLGSVAATVGAWALIGFDGLRDYPQVLSSLSSTVEGQGWSLVALGLAFGLPVGAAEVAAAVAGLALLAGAYAASRSARREQRTLGLTLAASLALSPVVWLHYFLLLAVPIALSRPRLAPIWFVPLALWISPYEETNGDFWRIAVGVAVAAVCFWSPRREPAGEPSVSGALSLPAQAA